ncbi:hypothetical protein [Haloimpatiens lingqiaonensis]|uniref:hypothetical protein n=1 Tax=Haloimpatiens lingqiaonensis TaxID=1380675 RepID=UPI0010FF5B21|nr:hypothetical protein [Haloimpatiens lingqiaonensis]
MKGFILDKNDEDYLKSYELKEMDKEINSKYEFDNITIANPKNSNSIYIIKNIFVKSENKNFYLRIGSGNREFSFEEKNMKFLFFNDVIEEKEYIHLASINNNEKKRVEMLPNKCIILLPKGFLNIKVDKPINNINIKILWKEEKIE